MMPRRWVDSACANWWLRDVVSASYFANVNNNGNANYNGASNTWVGVRPDFGGT